MPRSLVLLDFGRDGVMMELRLPVDRLQIGFGRELASDPARRVGSLRSELGTYLLEHISAHSPDGRAWQVALRDLGIAPESPAQEVVAHLWLAPPAGASARRFTLQYDVIQHQLLTHRALVSVRRDWNGGAVAGPPEILGEMGYRATMLRIDRPSGSAWRGFISVVQLGMLHIAEGTDHLLFLLVLLLPASLGSAGGRWRGYSGAGRSVRHLARIVSAFTVGHSITLAAGALGWIRMPNQPIEVLIALSILVSAAHAYRPLFPGREELIAGAFGLVHGLAFAGVIAEFGLDSWHRTLSILGFNLGIELMQLAILGLTVPWLLLLARTGVYAAVRVTGAMAAGVAALGWVAQRGGWILAALALLSVASTLRQTRLRSRYLAARSDPAAALRCSTASARPGTPARSAR
jgi:hypothetical protein